MMRARSGSAGSQAGLTLIELMVSILLASILVAGVFNMMIGQTRTYDSQIKATVKQENLWAAMEYLQRQIRLAGFGFGGCPSGVVGKWNDGSKLFENTSTVALQVFDSCSLFEDTSAYPPNVLSNCTARTAGTDAFAVLYSSAALNTSTMDVIPIKSHSTASTNIKATTCGGILENDLVIVSSPGSVTPCTILKVTKDPKTGKKDCNIQHNPSDIYNPPGGDLRTYLGNKDYPQNSTLFKLTAGVDDVPLKFAIDSVANPPRLVQWRGTDKAHAEVIADGIEDMQISFACDMNDNESLEEGPTFTLDEWAYNVTETWTGGGGALTSTTCGGTRNIAAVRITLVARSAGPEAGVKGRRPALENHAVGGSDNYARAVLTATVKPRNIARNKVGP